MFEILIRANQVLLVSAMAFSGIALRVGANKAETAAPRTRQSFGANWIFILSPEGELAIRNSFSRTADQLLLISKRLVAGTELANEAFPQTSVPDRAKPEFCDNGWTKISIPHDWAINAGFDLAYPSETGRLKYWGVGWY